MNKDKNKLEKTKTEGAKRAGLKKRRLGKKVVLTLSRNETVDNKRRKETLFKIVGEELIKNIKNGNIEC